MRATLGEDWPGRWYAPCGTMPPFIGDPATNALAYRQLVETSLRLDDLAGTLRLRHTATAVEAVSG